MPDWTYANAAHLLRRAGFGAPRGEVEKAVRRGQAKTVAALTTFRPSSAYFKQKGDVPAAARWWVERMLTTRAPLQEKLTLFWHGHFATAAQKVEDPKLLSLQNRTFRRHAAGKFRDMVQAVSRDPAMILWLDNFLNVKDAPNENYARELMELFTLGITDLDGNANYTEVDVREAARAFTGWTIIDGVFFFDADQHDFGSKTFRGRTGNFDGGEIVDQLVVERTCALFIAKKLWEFFAYRDPERQILEDLADVYLANDTAIAPVVRAIFLHEAFYSVRARTEHVVSPVHFLAGTLRTLHAKLRKTEALPYYLAAMGQELYNPPNVAGWPGHLAWMTSVTRLARMDFSWNVISQRHTPDYQFKVNPLTLLAGLGKRPTAEQIVDRVAETLGVPLTPQARADFVTYLTTRDDPEHPGTPLAVPVDLKNADFVDLKLRGLIGTLLSLPEASLA